LEAQTNVAFLQSELDALKSDYADQSLNSERYETIHNRGPFINFGEYILLCKDATFTGRFLRVCMCVCVLKNVSFKWPWEENTVNKQACVKNAFQIGIVA
jgi:hypothetical protein